MNVKLLPSKRSFLVGLLGTTILLGAPALTQADQGKWWTPKERGPRAAVRGRAVARVDRGWHRGPGPHRGGRVVRDFVVIRDGHRGPFFRARRLYVRPAFHRRVIFVRPVRYFIAADACLGGVAISARFHPRDHYLYGCNFCDAQFSSYDGYATHVGHCDHAPDGSRISARDWDDRELDEYEPNDRDEEFDRGNDFDRGSDFDRGEEYEN